MKQSAETIAKRAASMRAIRADPERNARWAAASAAGVRKWHSDPANAAAFSHRMSERMKRRHADPEWQKVRDARSSRVMKANWVKHRDLLTKAAVDRYARQLVAGDGLNSAEAKARKNAAAKWILKKANAALRAETDYVAKFTETVARLRREMPYDATGEASDYSEYQQRLGRAVASDPELRAIASAFLHDAIPRFAAEWHKLNRENEHG